MECETPFDGVRNSNPRTPALQIRVKHYAKWLLRVT